jgi:pimeloyl-[acyl-carrier protein] methyl ester esterase
LNSSTGTDRYLDFDGLARLRYRDDGHGPAVLLIHGWLLDLTMFDSLADGLVGAGFRVVRWDRRGFGDSTGTPGLAADVTDGLRLLEHLDIGTYAVLGMSQGCRVALALVESNVHQATCLVLDGPPPLEGLPDRGWLEETPAPVYRQLLLERGIAALRAELAKHPLLQLQTHNAHAQARLVTMLDRYAGTDLLATGSAAIATPNERFARLLLPVLVLNGEFDTHQRLRVGETLAQIIPDATRRVVPASRHLACWDNPATYVHFVADFLATNRHRWA